MELKWDDAPVPSPVVFSRDVFDKFTLAPTIQELYAFLQSPDVKDEETSEKKPDGPSLEPKCEKEVSEPSTSKSNESVEPISDRTQSQADVKLNLVKSNESKPFPEPMMPYPCFSALNVKDRRAYLGILKNKMYHTASKNLLCERVRNEVADFMKYLQDVSRACANGYNYMPLGGTRYSEEYFTACLELMKSYPQVYSIQEITGLTGGKIICDISLNFEKQLLAMGKIDMIEKKMMPENTKLAVDYETISSVIPPAKKASSLHAAVSSDSNAEKLSATYEPHVCLSKEALIRLMNNDSKFSEAWELPVCVKINPNRGNSQSKTAYIDPPLLMTEMSWRERSLLFHEESVKLALKRTVSRPIFFLTSEDLSNEMDLPPMEQSSRNVVAFDDAGMDFEVDLTDLESFGESCKPIKKVKEQNEPKTACTNAAEAPPQLTSSPKKLTNSQNPTKGNSTSKDNPEEPHDSTVTEIQGESYLSLTDGENGVLDESAVSEEELVKGSSEEKIGVLPSVQCPPAKRPRRMTTEDKLDHKSDSDEDRLVIDHIGTPQRPQTQKAEPSLEVSSPNVPDPATTNPLDKGTKKGVKRQRISGECDQLGQILQMQDAMLKPTPSKNQELLKPQVPEDRPTEHRTHSLVKPCVASYLESKEGLGEDVTMSTPVVLLATQKKRLLKKELQASAEDELDYDPPAEGSVLYKLYSLQDILFMVRSSVHIAHPRHDRETFRAVPVHVLTKLEYQLCYGAESLTHTEACQLWAEKLLHSSTVSYISRINAHTSEVAQIQELQNDWIQNITCDFKPARCLNNLYHLLKKVSTLQEGRYLLVHKPQEGFVTIFKASDGDKPARSLYHLQNVHCGPPVVSTGVPWVPLDPLHVLPFHQKHNRPPCTFPPRPPPQAKDGKGPQQGPGTKTVIRPPKETSPAGAANQNQAPKKKRNRQKKRKKWMEKMRAKLMNDLKKSQTNESERTSS
ncbi:little elongation complex subunit 2 [Xyrauchen texanus]|uniref:little elongation complex subunit 2 n=1 Tax=Xyrauchen texanus TaxID=154827 RepID=UPI0022422AED|nr:little elongation complex subunit 2 [Xyrauchen texanus]